VTDDGTESHVQDIQKAAPIAKSIVLFGNPLHYTANAVETFIGQITADVRAEPEAASDPDHETAVVAAQAAAYYSLGIALGLLLADQM
jgi:hypothetical protein